MPRRSQFILVLLLLAGALVLVNLLARRHARAMLHFSAGGARTVTPEELTPAARLGVLLRGVNLPRPEDPRPPATLTPDAREIRIPSTPPAQLCAWYAPQPAPAPLVLLFHGYSTDKTRLLPEARALHALGASVLLVDFRGSGGSPEAYTTLGYLEADDVAAAIAHARDHLPHTALILYGQSMGSAAILRAVHVHDVRPDAVILESVFDTMLAAIRSRFRAMGLPSTPGAELLVFWGGRAFHFNGLAHNPRRYARSLTCPALFLHGADDPRAPPAQARNVYAAARGPKRFVAFDDVGHGSYLARHPGAWHEVVRRFLDPFLAPEPSPSPQSATPNHQTGDP
ncbi:MAG: alpha/beta fold hydrolase [Lentisphaerae bacterium]|jgi:pimeloyl-ACP methyl ester carboxylesterase|nr:alpha/beta fold hydrolase [Lentisphaerota bacterium]